MQLGSLTLEIPDRTRQSGHRIISVTTMISPTEIGPFPWPDAIQDVVERALAFHKRILAVYCLGDNLPPIVATQGKRPIYDTGEGRVVEDDDSLHFTVDCNGFHSLGSALVYAIAIRDRKNPSDARATATAIQRLLTAPQD